MKYRKLLSAIGMAVLLLLSSVTAYGQAMPSGERLKNLAPADLAVGGALSRYNTYAFAPTRILANREFNAITGTTFLSQSWPTQTANPNTAAIAGVASWTHNSGKLFHGHALCYPAQNSKVNWWTNQSDAQLVTNLEKLVKNHAISANANGRQTWVWDVVNEVMADPAQLDLADAGNFTYADNLGVAKGTTPAGDGVLVPHIEYTVFDRLSGVNWGPGYIAACFTWARQVDANAILIINDYGCEEERIPNGSNGLKRNKKADKLFEFCKLLKSQGVPIQGVGFQCHFEAYNAPNFQEIRNNFQRFADEGFQIFITELDVETVATDDPNVGSTANQNAQATVFREMAQIAVDMPAVKSLLLWDFVDERSWLHDSSQGAPYRTHPTPFWGGLASANGSDIFAKKAYYDIQTVLQNAGGLAAGEYRLKNEWTGNYLSTSTASSANFVYSWGYNPAAYSMRWHLEPTGEPNEYRLRNAWRTPGQPFNYLHGTSSINNSRVRAWRDQPTWWWQKWTLENVSGNTYRLKNKVSGLYLNNAGNGMVRNYEDRTWSSQRWELEPVN